jgi:hypothetical protein
MFAEIYTALSPSEAEIIISLLRANGIHPLDLEMSPRIGFAGADLFYHVRVPQEEVEAAKQVLNSNDPIDDGLRGHPDCDDSRFKRQSSATWWILLIMLLVIGLLVGFIIR